MNSRMTNNMSINSGTFNNIYANNQYIGSNTAVNYNLPNVSITNSYITNATNNNLSLSSGTIMNLNVNSFSANNILVTNGTLNNINTASLNINKTSIKSSGTMTIILPQNNGNLGNILSTNGDNTTSWFIPNWIKNTNNTIYTNYNTSIGTNNNNGSLTILTPNTTAINILNSDNLNNYIMNIIGSNSNTYNITYNNNNNNNNLVCINIGINLLLDSFYTSFIQLCNIGMSVTDGSNAITNTIINIIFITLSKVQFLNTNILNTININDNNNSKISAYKVNYNYTIITNVINNYTKDSFNISSQTTLYDSLNQEINGVQPNYNLFFNQQVINVGLYMLLCYSNQKQNNNTTNLPVHVFMLDFNCKQAFPLNILNPSWLEITYNTVNSTFDIKNLKNYQINGIQFYIYRYL